jgi:hypothetical protein
MPSKKQQRRRQKLKRHEYEEVYVDEEGNELAPEVAEELVATSPSRNGKPAKAQPTRRGGPHDRAALMASHSEARASLLPADAHHRLPDRGDQVTTAGKIVQTIALMGFFLPFSYFMDTMVWRAAQRRLERGDETKKR